MAHEVYLFDDGRYSMAYSGKPPWHGLGNEVSPDAPPEVWAKEAKMEWSVVKRPLFFGIDKPAPDFSGTSTFQRLFGKEVPKREHHVPISDRFAIVRDDNEACLSIMSDRYQPVQPREVLSFYHDLLAANAYRMETAGSLCKGAKVWALAKVNGEIVVGGEDKLRTYLLLMTSYDGTMSTTAQLTTVRVVCNNTLQLAYGLGKNGGEASIKLPHVVKWTDEVAQGMKIQLGVLPETQERIRAEAQRLASRKMSNKEAVEFLFYAMGYADIPVEEQPNAKTVAKIVHLFAGGAAGSSMPTASGTAWGLVNAVTQFVDHHRGRTPDSRLNAAWFGAGSKLKQSVYEKLAKYAA